MATLSASAIAAIADHLASRLAADPGIASVGGPIPHDVDRHFSQADLSNALLDAGLEVTADTLAFLRVATYFAADVVPDPT